MPDISLPNPGVTPGPGWAAQLNTAITAINTDVDTRLSDAQLSAKIDAEVATQVPGSVSEALADPETTTIVTDAANAAVAVAVTGSGMARVSSADAVSVDLSWGEIESAYPETYPADGLYPAGTSVPRMQSVAGLDGAGKVDTSVIPALPYATDTALTSVARVGRPAYVPTEGSWDAAHSLWNFDPAKITRWAVARELARAGKGKATCLVLSDSTGEIVGNAQPGQNYIDDAWPGQLRARLAGMGIASSGSGLHKPSTSIPVTTHIGGIADPGMDYANPGTATNKIEQYAGGFFASSMVKITDDGTRTAHLTLTAAAGPFTELILTGGEHDGPTIVTIDGADRTWAGSVADTTADIPVLMAGVRRSKLTLSAGTHTIRVHGSPAGVLFGGFLPTGPFGFEVVRGAVAGKSLNGLMAPTQVSAVTGLEYVVDQWAPHVVIDGLMLNSWQGHHDLATFKAQKVALWQRAIAQGASVLAIIPPRPDFTLYPPDGIDNPSFNAYVAAVYEAAAIVGIPVLDLAHRWWSYSHSAAMFPTTTDHIHPLAYPGLSDFVTAILYVLTA